MIAPSKGRIFMKTIAMNKCSLHKKYMEAYEYRTMIARYDKECKELSHRFETTDDKIQRIKSENQKERERNRLEKDLERLLERNRK